MTLEINSQFKKRFKSFCWRLGSVIVVAGLSFTAENVAGLGLPNWAVLMVGLGCGEVTKYLNKKKPLDKPIE